MWVFNRFLGFGLMLGGISILAQRLYVTTRGYTIDAPTIILSVIGIIILVYGGEFKKVGWVVIVVGILMPLIKAGIVVASTTLFTFLLCFLAIVYGYKLVSRGRF